MKHLNTRIPRSMGGFTLLEIMITLAIAAILLAAAAPSFTNMIRSNKITTYANDFGTTVNLARSEAIKRGGTVTISSTSGNTDWSQGWTLTVDSTGELLRTNAAFTGDNTFVSGVNNSFSFTSRGATTLAAADNLSLCNVNIPEGRRIRVAVTGRISVLEINPCP